MRVRIVSYNIMRGGEGRADPIAEVILAQKADVVGIHEAEDATVLQRLARRLDMQFVVSASLSGRMALFSKLPIIASLNVALVHNSSMPVLDAILAVGDGILPVRVAHATHAAEANRMAEKIGGRLPMAMMMSYESPLGRRVVDGVVMSASDPVPEKTFAPPRLLDEVMIPPGVKVIETWIEQDRLAYYASDHLPGGAEIELA